MGRVSFGHRVEPEVGALFGSWMAWNNIFRVRGTSDPLQSNCVAAMKAVGMSVCQGTPWSEGLDGKELHGAAWW